MDVKPLHVIANLIMTLSFWTIVLTIGAVIFQYCWNQSVPDVFGLQALTRSQSLCLLACCWVASRVIARPIVVEGKKS